MRMYWIFFVLLFASIQLWSATLTSAYEFNNNLNDSIANGVDPALVTGTHPNGSGTVGNGYFSFGANQGLTMTGGVIDINCYSVELYFEFDDVGSGWRTIMDPGDARSDRNLYVYYGGLQFYPFGASGAVFSPNTYTHVVATRNTDGTFIGYVNGQQLININDGSNTAAEGNVIHFFEDNSTAEASAGTVDYIRIYNGVLTQSEITTLYQNRTQSIGSTPTPALGSSNTNFGNVRVGTSASASVTVTNTGAASSVLTGTIGPATGSEFSPVSGNQSFSLGQNQTSTRSYTYTPSARGADLTTISIASNASNTNRTLTGTGVSPVFSSSVAAGSAINFGEVGYTATQNLTVQNTTPDADLGNLTDMTLISATITGADASYFSLGNFTPGMKLTKSQLQTLAIQFMHNYSSSSEYGYVRQANLVLTTDVGAALGSVGQSYTYLLQATTIPEMNTAILLFLSLVFGFVVYKK
ncbi:MAG: choice-of-anchor D domain-containing protein [Candidatus Brocadiae bacterium]|nr:choice-of-anchor D domain-containing protein [Candidatus Brocadiia bacterium]